MDIITMRLEAPMMSFGAPIVDRYGMIQPYPALSMITGMLANALGISHTEADRLQRLQERLKYASRRDRAGQRKRDYQTVALDLPYMSDELAWTTWGKLQERKGGKVETHIRLRDYWADSAHTIALTLTPPDENPTMEELAQALRNPERPLFIGRKTCLPATPVFLEHTHAGNLVEALKNAPLAEEPDSHERLDAWWPADKPDSDRARPITDQRDWVNQIHVGQRWITSGKIKISSEEASTNEKPA